jgi:hypothetical protein
MTPKEKKINNVVDAVDEAHRFIKRADAYIQRLATDKWAEYSCKESAAMKRASMDLTRALVKIRRFKQLA